MGTNAANRSRWLRRYLPAVLALFMGLALTGVAFAATRMLVRERVEQQFERRAADVLNTLAAGMSRMVEVLQSIRSFFAASENVTREDFQIFVDEQIARNPGIQAFSWVPRVSAAERATFEAAASRVYGRDFRILEIRSGDSIAPARRRPEYFPVFYIEPFEENAGALGVDLASEPMRRDALERAARSGAAEATAWLHLIQGGIGFNVFLPVDVADEPVELPGIQHGDGAAGFAIGVFRLEDVIPAAAPTLGESVDFFLYEADAPPGRRRIYQYEAATHSLAPAPAVRIPPDIPRGFLRAGTLHVAGRRWSLIFYPTPRFLATATTWEPWLILAAGTLLTALLTLYLWTSAHRTAQIAGINRSLAAEATRRREIERELRETGERNRFLAETSAVLVSSLDYETTLRTVARLAVPKIAEWCIVHVLDPDGTVRRIEVAAADPALEGRIRDLLERYPPPRSEELPLARAIQTRQPQFYQDLTREQIIKLARDPEQARAFLDIGVRSLLTVPLVARGRTLGAFTFATTGDHRLDQDDVALADELARRAALAVDNARLYEAAQAASEAKSDFLAVMSHELRTPLNAIMGFADLLLMGVSGPLDDVQTKQVERINASARHLLELIEEILGFSRMQEGTERLRLEDVDLSTVLETPAERARRDAAAKGLGFRLEPPDRPVTLETDPAKLQQAVGNLLSNAVKFTDRGEVRLRSWEQNGKVYIQIQDTGIGITPEQRRRLFEPFWQAEAPMTRRVGGTGLGLTVARRLIHLLGGDITVDSSPGKGSTFTIEIPRKRDHDTRKEEA
ncbi:MAG TPA: CHASE domain-containing protein [Longimicrobiales bacterium]